MILTLLAGKDPPPPFFSLQQDGIEPRFFTFPMPHYNNSLQRWWLSWQQLWHAHLWFMHTEGCRSLRFSQQWRIIQCISAPMTLVLFIRRGLQSAATICLTAAPYIPPSLSLSPSLQHPHITIQMLRAPSSQNEYQKGTEAYKIANSL